MADNNILLLNLFGKRFLLPHTLVADYSQTLLGNPSLLAQYYRLDTQDYYFERNPLLFPYILTYYTIEQKIFCPHHIPMELIEYECQFFMLHDAHIYGETNRIVNFRYFKKNKKKNRWLDVILFLTGLFFMITASMETWKPPNQFYIDRSWSLSYFVDLIGTILLVGSIFYRIIIEREFFDNKQFLFDFFCTISSIFILANRNLAMLSNNSIVYSLLMIVKICRLLIVIAHCHIMQCIIMIFIQRFHTVCTLVFINILITGTFSQIALGFERRQQSEQSIFKTYLDSFWWATTLSFTIGYGYTDPHPSLTIVGRFCGYMLTFFGLLFNGLILQELVKGFLKLEREQQEA